MSEDRELFRRAVKALSDKQYRFVMDNDANFLMVFRPLWDDPEATISINTVLTAIMKNPNLASVPVQEVERIKQEQIKQATDNYNNILRNASPSELVPVVAAEAREHQLEAKNAQAQSCIDRRVQTEKAMNYPPLPERWNSKIVNSRYLKSLLNTDIRLYKFFCEKFGTGAVSQRLNQK